ncbi:hypothetical protein B0J12DRAFT_681750 [Macrophomina phaseolina]|uniref:Secreted protein n=1 Tax=Macrophomina phaseolina TaxID=35725 RepID=A0ABQ8FW65_9PEZI|nr:hypothetical protein B0J12DRAFT_681750 [Macrophomina phaseolina]
MRSMPQVIPALVISPSHLSCLRADAAALECDGTRGAAPANGGVLVGGRGETLLRALNRLCVRIIHGVRFHFIIVDEVSLIVFHLRITAGIRGPCAVSMSTIDKLPVTSLWVILVVVVVLAEVFLPGRIVVELAVLRPLHQNGKPELGRDQLA